MSETYTREDMARAWDEGYEAGYDMATWAETGVGESEPTHPNPYRDIPPAEVCCAPDEGEEHCDHHPEWSDAHGCNHPKCKAARDNPPEVS